MNEPSTNTRKPATTKCFWLLVAIGGVIYFNSCRANMASDAAQWSRTKAQYKKRLLANISTFERKMPRPELVAYVESFPGDFSGSFNSANLQLERGWDLESIADQRRLMNVWANTWFDVVKSNTASDEKPALWLHGPDGSLVESLTPLTDAKD